jgi:integrase
MTRSSPSRTTTTTQTPRSAPCPSSGLKIIQDQMGHEHASTTGIYQFVSDEFRRSTLRSALDRTVNEAMQRGTEGGAS